MNAFRFAVALLLVGCTHIEEGPFAPLHSDGQVLRDALGRQVILRAVQHHALQDVRYQGREVRDQDYAQIRAWGFSALRVAISWSRVEPSRGMYDSSYIEELRGVLDRAHAAGLHAIIEWHQDLYGKCTQRPGAAQEANANGAPDWACGAEIAPAAVAHLAQFDRFWRNEDDVQDAFVEAWAHVAAATNDHPAVLGYELLNEPAGDEDFLLPAYRKLVPALRARGATGLLLLDAPVLRNETLQMKTERLELGPDVVFAPHLYTGWFAMYVLRAPTPQEEKARDFRLAAEQAQALGLAWWNGEWGTNLAIPSALDDVRTHIELEDSYAVGSSYWAFQRATPGQGDDSISGGTSLLDETGAPREVLVALLSRPYPIKTPGTLRSLRYDFAAKRMTLKVEASGDPAPLVLYTPFPDPCLRVDGGGYAARQLGDRLLVRLDEAARYEVQLGAQCP